MHICFISQLDGKIFEFRWCVTFSFTLIFVCSRKFGQSIPFFFIITNSFYFIGDWQVKFFLMWMPFSPSRKGTDLNRNEIPPNSFLSTVSTKLYTDTLLSRFLLSTRGRAHVHSQTCESFFCHPSFPFSCLLFLLSLQKITESDWRK